ncbi:toxin-antitoxin system [Rhodococcus hoagii]|nr:toxin-antitoxin system [Prescottella equi]NKS56445.1 toxin-antitoxin system [Prescottella equi]NKZ93470.1 toxin-antitoxin system [Prescottella equi]
MAAPHKGPRTRVVSRVPDAVYAELERRRIAAGVSSVSQYVSDLLASTTGYRELVRELDQEVLLTA